MQACGEHFDNPDGSKSLVGTCLNVTEMMKLRQRDVAHAVREKELEAKLKRNTEVRTLSVLQNTMFTT